MCDIRCSWITSIILFHARHPSWYLNVRRDNFIVSEIPDSGASVRKKNNYKIGHASFWYSRTYVRPCFRYQNLAEVPSAKTTRYGLWSFRFFASKHWNKAKLLATSNIIQLIQKFLEWQLVALQCVCMNLVFLYVFI